MSLSPSSPSVQPRLRVRPGGLGGFGQEWPGWLYALLLSGLPIGVMIWVWAHNAVNVPKWDDHALKYFLVLLEGESSPLGWFRQVIRQHNEHRIAYDRLLTWADYTLFGKLSFKRLMAYGDLSLLALMGLFALFTARYVRRWYLYLPPIVLLIGSLAQWENFFWALSSIQNFSIVVWSLACLYALAHRPAVWLAIGLGAGATLVSGNGFLVWPIGLLMLLAQRRFRAILPWSIAAGLLIALYFGDYVQPTTHPPTRGNAAELAGGVLAFLGAAADALPTAHPYGWSIGLGVILLLYWGWTTGRSALSFRHNSLTPLQAFGLGALAFLVGTAVVVVWGRFGYGKDMLLTSRYRIYSLTLLTLTYTYWLSVTYQKRVASTISTRTAWLYALGGLAIGGGLWWSALRLNTHETIALHKMLLTSQYNWTYTENRPVSTIDDTTRRLIDNAPAFYDGSLPAYFGPEQGSPYPIDTLFKTAQAYVIRLAPPAPSAVPSLAHPDREAYVLLRSVKRTYLYGAMPAPRRHWRVWLNLPLYDARQPLDVIIPTNEVDAGTYAVLVAEYTAEQPTGRVRPTGQLLTAAPHQRATGPVKNW